MSKAGQYISDRLTQWLSEHGGVEPEGQQVNTPGQEQQGNMTGQVRQEDTLGRIQHEDTPEQAYEVPPVQTQQNEMTVCGVSYSGTGPLNPAWEIFWKMNGTPPPEQANTTAPAKTAAENSTDSVCQHDDACELSGDEQNTVSAMDEQHQNASVQQNVATTGNILDLPVNQYMHRKAAQNRQQQDVKMQKLFEQGKEVDWMDELERSSYEGAKHDVVVLRDKLHKMQQEMDRLQAELEQERDLKQEAIRAANEANDAERVYRTALAEVHKGVTDLLEHQNHTTECLEERIIQFIRAAKVSNIEVYFDTGSW